MGIDEALSRQPELAPGVRAVPGIRLPGAVNPHEMLIRALTGQQISVAAARTQLSRLAAAFGTPLPEPRNGLTTLFPTPAQVAEHGRGVLVGPRARSESILTIAGRLASGDLDLSWADDPKDQHDRLVAEPGIGEWTAGYIAMRVLGNPDVLPTATAPCARERAGSACPARRKTPPLAAWGNRVPVAFLRQPSTCGRARPDDRRNP